jgi:hypothetical protein
VYCYPQNPPARFFRRDKLYSFVPRPSRHPAIFEIPKRGGRDTSRPSFHRRGFGGHPPAPSHRSLGGYSHFLVTFYSSGRANWTSREGLKPVEGGRAADRITPVPGCGGRLHSAPAGFHRYCARMANNPNRSFKEKT